MVKALHRQLDPESRFVSVVKLAEQPGYRVILREAALSRKSVDLIASWPELEEIVIDGHAADLDAESSLRASFTQWHSSIGAMNVFMRTEQFSH